MSDYLENLTAALKGEYKRYVQNMNRCRYPVANARYRHLLKLAEFQNMAKQGSRKYQPPKAETE